MLQKYTFSATKARIKEVVKKYGPFAVGTHATVYAVTLGCVYSLIGQGVDIANLVEWLPYSVDKDEFEVASGQVGRSPTSLSVLLLYIPPSLTCDILFCQQFAAAYALTVLTGPPRAVITVLASPHVTRAWHMHIKPRPAPLIVLDNSRECKIVKEGVDDFIKRKDSDVVSGL